MLEKIEVNKDYMYSTVRVTVLFVGRRSLFYKTYSGEGSCDISYAKANWSEILVEKKPTKFLAYVDEDGGFFYCEERMSVHKSCKRIPSKDFQAIVEV